MSDESSIADGNDLLQLVNELQATVESLLDEDTEDDEDQFPAPSFNVDEFPDPLVGLLLTNQHIRGPPPPPDSPPLLLLAACLRGDLEEVRLLASHPSVSIEASPLFLHVAIQEGHLEVVDFLLKEGADKNASFQEKCPLHLAFIFNHFEIFKYLLNFGADLSRLHEELPDALHEAASQEQLNFVEFFISQGADVNAHDSTNKTPLHYVKQNLEVAELLVKNGADVNAKGDFEMTPLHVASSGKDRAAFADFLIRSGAVVDAKINSGSTPLHIASIAGNLSTMKILLSAGADVNAVDNDKKSPLYYAVQHDPSLEAIQFLVENSVEVWAEDVNGLTALDCAIFREKDEAVVKYLLSFPLPAKKKPFSGSQIVLVMKNYSEEILKAVIAAGADVNEPYNEAGNTPLHYAAFAGSLNFVEILVTAGSSVDALDDKKNSPVEFALDLQHLDVAEYLLARSSVKVQRSEILEDGLKTALSERRLSLARLLIQRGANPNRTAGVTFLQFFVADEENRVDALEFLLEEGADPNEAGDLNLLPLHIAAGTPNLPMVKALVAAGAKVNSKGQRGFTPFIEACRTGELALINFLIESGADIFDTSDDKTSALHWASMCGRLEVMKFLVSKGFDINAATDLPEGGTPLHFAAGMHGEDFTRQLRAILDDEMKKKVIEGEMKREGFSLCGYPAAARLLAEEGAEVNALDGKGRSALHYFCAHGDLPTATFLIGKGAKVDDISYSRGAPLHSACAGGQFPMVKFLLTQGADTSAKNSRGDSPAATAALGGHWALLPLLGVDDHDILPLQMVASRGEVPEEIPPELINSLGVLGYSPLHFGALNGHLSVVRRLLQLGADATLKGTNEHVIHSAIRGKNEEVVKEVLAAIWTSCEENGSHLHVEMNRREDSAQETPFMTAVRSGKMELVKLLAEEETVNVHLHNEDGLTALHVAAEENLIDIAEFLLTLKVDATSRDTLGRTPYDIAKQSGFEEILRVLPNVPRLDDPPLTFQADPVTKEAEVKVTGGKALQEEDGTGSDSPREEEETQGPQVTQSPITQQPFPLIVAGAEKETSEASTPSEEQRGGVSDEKKQQRSSCLSVIFCCCSSSN